MRRTSYLLAATISAASPASAQLGSTYCHATANSTGLAASLTATGTLDVTVNDVVLHGGSLPPGALSMLVSSTQRAVLPGFAGTANTLCLGGALGRHVATLAPADPSGVVAMPLDTQLVPHPTQPFALVRGDTLNFQLWFRDTTPAGAATSGLSDGLSLTFCPEPPFDEGWYAVPPGSSFVRAADLDRDGHSDLICTSTGVFTILYGRAGGGFESAVEVSTQHPLTTGCHLEAVSDLDGDGLPELVCKGTPYSYLAAPLAIIEQRAPRQFDPPRLLSTADFYFRVVADDLDGDGALDLVGISQGSQVLHALRGDGLGGFASPQVLDAPVGSTFWALGSTDLDGDGRAEVYASTSWLTHFVYAWSGPAGLALSTSRVVGAGSILFFDVDSDGDRDYVAPTSSATSVLRNLGNGVLAPLQERYASPVGYYDTHEDVDSDGDVDVVFRTWTNDVHTLWNDGTGVFFATAPAANGAPSGPRTYADVDGDGRFEAVDLQFQSQLTVRERTGPESVAAYTSPTLITPTGAPVRALDVDGDGFEELLSYAAGQLEFVHYSAGWGAPQSVPYPGVSQPADLEFVDLDGDHDLDLLEVDTSTGVTRLDTHRQVGPLTFAATSTLVVDPSLRYLAVGDLEGDGDQDVVLMQAAGTNVHVYSMVNGLWQGPVIHDAWQLDPLTAVLAEVTGDGLLDLVYSGSAAPLCCEGRPGGAFAAAVPLGASLALSGRDFLLADLDGDGVVELVHARAPTWASTTLVIHRRTGANQFDIGTAHQITEGITRLEAFDREGDGDRDLLCDHPLSPGMSLLENRGDGTFRAPRYLFTGSNIVSSSFAGDFDHDGDRDVVFFDGAWRVLENRCR